jgi:hypothetical protein
MNFFQAIKNPTYRNSFIIGLIFIYAALRLTGYVDYVADNRTGVQLYDPIIAMLPPVADYSPYIFFCTYGIIIAMVLYGVFKAPMMLVQYCYGLAFIKIVRCFTIWNIPLEPPVGIIRLRDVLIESVTPHGISTAKDLFFSGHAATTMFAALLIVHPTMRKAGIMVAFFVAFLILNQRVHYSIDILGGWLMAFMCYQVVQYAPPILDPQMAKLEAQQQEGI